MRISQRDVDLIKRHEGLRLDAYRDAVGVVTIGYGHIRALKRGAARSGRREVTIEKQKRSSRCRRQGETGGGGCSQR